MLFQNLPFDRIVVHVSLPENGVTKEEVASSLQRYPVDEIIFTPNSGHGEADALAAFVNISDLSEYSVFTYMHCKGVTKPGNPHIIEWVKLMRYFIIDRMDQCNMAFKRGFVTFGINKSIPSQTDDGFRGSNFFYEGNFVSVNLTKVDLKSSVAEKMEKSYYGVEGFWGKLCDYELGYSVFRSGVNHYLISIPEKIYTSVIGRLKYRAILEYHNLKSKFFKVK